MAPILLAPAAGIPICKNFPQSRILYNMMPKIRRRYCFHCYFYFLGFGVDIIKLIAIVKAAGIINFLDFYFIELNDCQLFKWHIFHNKPFF